MEAFAGIDLAFAKNKRLPVCLCIRQNDRLIPLPLAKSNAPPPPRGRGNKASIDTVTVKQFAHETVNYLRSLEVYFGVSISRIAIDAPSAPRKESQRRRDCESALDRHNISCFTTPSNTEFQSKVNKVKIHLANGGSESSLPAANQLWMLVGFALFESLEAEWECIEVYPQATMRVLNAAQQHKSKKEGIAAQIEAIVQYTGWYDPLIGKPEEELKKVVGGPAHDGLDAYASAWIASLAQNERRAFGTPPKDAIWVPIPSEIRTIDRS